MPEDQNTTAISNKNITLLLNSTIKSWLRNKGNAPSVKAELVNDILQLTITTRTAMCEDYSVLDVIQALHDSWMTLQSFVEQSAT